MQFDANGWLDEAIEIDYLNKSMSRQGHKITYIVLHGTAGGSSAEAIANYFATSAVDASSNIIIDQAANIVQGIPLSLAAWGNGVLTSGHAQYLPDDVNPNLYTVSIEHVKSSTDNSDALTPIQAQKSFEVIQCICNTYGVPMRAGDAIGGIITHANIDPINRSRCPGPYPWDQLWAFLNQGGNNTMNVPAGWTLSSDQKTLTAKNGVDMRMGFMGGVLNDPNWNPDNVPLVEEYHVANVQLHNLGLGPGQVQPCRDGIFWWTPQKGVIYEPYLGLEIKACYDRIAAQQAQIATLQTQVQSQQTTKDLQAIAAIADKYK